MIGRKREMLRESHTGTNRDREREMRKSGERGERENNEEGEKSLKESIREKVTYCT